MASLPTPTARQSFAAGLKSPQFLAAVGAPLVALGATMAQQHYRNKEETQAKAHAFREMLDLHPHFKGRDPMEVARIYNSLHRASPGMAKDPLVAGAYVDNIIENKTPGMNSHQAVLNAVKDLSAIEKNVTDAAGNRMKQSPFNWGQTAENLFRSGIEGHHIGRMNSFQASVDEGLANIKAKEEAHNLKMDKANIQGQLLGLRTKEFKMLEREVKEKADNADAANKRHEAAIGEHWQGMFNELKADESGFERRTNYRNPYELPLADRQRYGGYLGPRASGDSTPSSSRRRVIDMSGGGGGGTKTSSLREILRSLKV